MLTTLNKEDEIGIVLIGGEKYKSLREAAGMFNSQHPEKIFITK